MRSREPQERAAGGRLKMLAAAAAVGLVIILLALAHDGGASKPASTPPAHRPATAAARTTPSPAVQPPAAAPARFAVGLTTMPLIDRSRTVRFPGGRAGPRRLITYVRYPALATPGSTERGGARPDRTHGPYPLVIFGHGFALTPGVYARLLRAWTRAGYVVAAPVFPLENANAPGGPDESDLVNQPGDMSFVISQLVAASRSGRGPLSAMIDAGRIAAAGHSDGGETALAAGYDPAFRDRRVGAVVILSGARIPGRGLRSGGGRVAVLATQGTADTINLPSATNDFFAAVARPKFLLRLYGAGHEGPYENAQPQLGIVRRVTTAFLDRYLKGRPVSVRQLRDAGTVRGLAGLLASP